MEKKTINWSIVEPELIKLVNEGKLGKAQIAEELGIGKTTVRSKIIELGLNFKNPNTPFWKGRESEIIKDLGSGKQYPELAKKYGVNTSTFKNAVSSKGWSKYYVSGIKWVPSEIKRLKSYLDQGMSYDEISKEFPNRDKSYIISFVNINKEKYGLEYKGNKNFVCTDEILDKVLSYLTDGKSFPEAAELVGCSRVETIRDRFKKKYGYNLYNKFLKHNTKISKEDLESYIKFGMSYSEIAELYNTSIGTIKRARTKLGIKLKIKKRSYKVPKVSSSVVLTEEDLITKYGKNKYEAVKLFLGRDPKQDDLKKNYKNIFTKEYVENALIDQKFSIPNTAKKLLVSGSTVTFLKNTLI